MREKNSIHVLFRKVDARAQYIIMQKHDSCDAKTVVLMSRFGR